MNKGSNSCKCYLKWPHKQVYCCLKIKLKLLMIVLFICIYTYMYSYTKIFLYNIAVLYHSFTHSIYLYMLCKNNFYLFHMACLFPGVNSAISVRDEWTNISQWMKLNYVFSELEIGQRSKHQIILVITCILNCTYSEIYDLIKTLHCCWFFLSLKR